MTDTDQGGTTPVPFTNNVNIMQAVALGAAALMYFTGGKLSLSPADQLTIVAAITAGTALVTMVLHTFVNHKNNVASAMAYARRAELSVRSGVGRVVLLCALGGMLLGGCAVFGGNPQAQLSAVQTAFNSALAIYTSVCMNNATAAFCTPQDQAMAASLEQAVSDAISLAGVALKASSGGASSADFATAIASAEDAINKFDNFVNHLSADKSAKLAAKLRSK